MLPIVARDVPLNHPEGGAHLDITYNGLAFLSRPLGGEQLSRRSGDSQCCLDVATDKLPAWLTSRMSMTVFL